MILHYLQMTHILDLSLGFTARFPIGAFLLLLLRDAADGPSDTYKALALRGLSGFYRIGLFVLSRKHGTRSVHIFKHYGFGYNIS